MPRLFAPLLVLLACTGCAYDARWKAAGQQPMRPETIEGRWIGTWESHATGHRGGLRCIVSQVEDGLFKTDFRASYAGLFSFGYDTRMRVTGSDQAMPPSVVYFSGSEDLGWLAGGLYEYQGLITPTSFRCHYRTAKDCGVFQLVRPGGAVASTVEPSATAAAEGSQPGTVANGDPPRR